MNQGSKLGVTKSPLRQNHKDVVLVIWASQWPFFGNAPPHCTLSSFNISVNRLQTLSISASAAAQREGLELGRPTVSSQLCHTRALGP